MQADEPARIGDARGDIVALEAELDALEEAAERCRKIVQVSGAAMAIGAGVLGIGFWHGAATSLVVGIAAILGGFVMAGSTRTTRLGILAQVASAERRRTALIDTLDVQDATSGTVARRRPMNGQA